MTGERSVQIDRTRRSERGSEVQAVGQREGCKLHGHLGKLTGWWQVKAAEAALKSHSSISKDLAVLE